MIKAKVIELPKEGLTADVLEGIINRFIAEERPKKIISIEFNDAFAYLIIVYEKRGRW